MDDFNKGLKEAHALVDSLNSLIGELRQEASKPFPELRGYKCTSLERSLIEKMGQYSKQNQFVKVLELGNRIGLVDKEEVTKAYSTLKCLLDEAFEMSDMLLKERFVFQV